MGNGDGMDGTDDKIEGFIPPILSIQAIQAIGRASARQPKKAVAQASSLCWSRAPFPGRAT